MVQQTRRYASGSSAPPLPPPQYVCSAQYGCFFNCVLSWYVAQVLSEWFIIIIIIITIIKSLVTGLFFLVFLLNQQWSPLLRLLVSDWNTFVLCVTFQVLLFFIVITTTTTISLLACISATETGMSKNSAMCSLQNDETCTMAVWEVSGNFEYLENWSRGLDVTWQPVRGDLTVHPWTVTLPWG